MEKKNKQDKRFLRVVAALFLFIALGAWAITDLKLPGGYSILPNKAGEKKEDKSREGVRNDSDIDDFKLVDKNGVKSIESSLFKLSAPPSWDLGVVLYQKDGPNVIIATSNSTDLGSMAVLVGGVVKGKFQLVGREKAEEFSTLAEKDLLNTKSGFWKDRIEKLKTSEMVSVNVGKVKINGDEYVKQIVVLTDMKTQKVLVNKITYYRFEANNLVAFDFEYGSDVKKEILDQIEKVIMGLEI